VELRFQKEVNNVRRLTESSTCDNTEEPSGYLEPTTLCRINEFDFFLSPHLGDVSFIDDSIANAVDFGPEQFGANNLGMNQRTETN